MFTNYSEFTEYCLAFGFSSCLASAKTPAKRSAGNKFGLLIDLCSMKSHPKILIDLFSMKSHPKKPARKETAKSCPKCCCVFAIYLLNKFYLIEQLFRIY